MCASVLQKNTVAEECEGGNVKARKEEQRT